MLLMVISLLYQVLWANKFIVSVRTSGEQRDADGISLLIVNKDTDGLSVRDYPTVDGYWIMFLKIT